MNASADETQSRKPLAFQLEETPHLGWRQSWRAAPRELRTAVLLVVPLVAVAVLRLWMVSAHTAEFIVAYGDSQHLDLSTLLGQVVAERDHPGVSDSAFFTLVCAGPVLASLLARAVRAGWLSLYAAAGVGVITAGNALGSIGQPAPWWYQATSFVAFVIGAAVVVLTLRPACRAYVSRW